MRKQIRRIDDLGLEKSRFATLKIEAYYRHQEIVMVQGNCPPAPTLLPISSSAKEFRTRNRAYLSKKIRKIAMRPRLDELETRRKILLE